MNFLLTSIRDKVSLAVSTKPQMASGIILMLLLCLASVRVSALGPIHDHLKGWSDYIPVTWQESVFVPSLSTTLTVVNIGPADSGTMGHSDVTLRYLVKNNGMDTLDDVQLIFDLVDQMGSPPFIALTGSLSGFTGSGMAFGSRMFVGDDFFGGGLNASYNGANEDNLFTSFPSLAPDECIAIDIPFELGDTTGIGTISLTANATATSRVDGSMIDTSSSPLELVEGCESLSLACAGQVNVTLGDDCTGFIGLNTVFLNTVNDTSRFFVEVFDGETSLGNMVNEDHIGRSITYTVYDRCFGDRASCWGSINVENKRTPTRTSTFREIVCGQTPPGILDLDEIEELHATACSVELSDFTETFVTSGERCQDGLIRRVVTASYTIEGFLVVDTIHVDSILEKAHDIMTFSCPLGPDADNPVYINCDDVDGVPSPEFIEAYFNDSLQIPNAGIPYAYPHILVGSDTMEMFIEKDTILETKVDSVIDVDGIPINIEVVLRDTLTIIDTIEVVSPAYVALREGTSCNLTSTFDDEFFAGCAGPESKILRTWRILNWCSGDVRECTQWIVLVDSIGPEITLAQDTVEVAITLENCTAEIALEALVTDNCSQIRNLNWSANAGNIDSDQILRDLRPSDSPVLVTLQAIDDCGNESVDVKVVYVVDEIAPVAIARDQINTTIIFDPIEDRGIAKVTASNLDNGSHDSGCGPVVFCALLDEELQNPIRDALGNPVMDSLGNILYRAAQCVIDGVYEGTPYVICKEEVKLCCENLGDNRVALVVNDFSDRSSFGVSWTIVTVEDKSFPIITCNDTTVTCGTDISPEVLGFPDFAAGLCSGGALIHSDNEDIDECGEGLITRFWTVNGDTTCIQLITIATESGSFDPMTIKWPKHYDDQVVMGVKRWCEADTIAETIDTISMGGSFTCSQGQLAEPTWCLSECGLLATSFEDQNASQSDACSKIIRRWTIVDWCSYDANSINPDVDDDSFEAVDDSALGTDFFFPNLAVGDSCLICEKPNVPDLDPVYFRYTSVDRDGFYTFEQVIQIIDDTPPVVDAPREVEVEISDGATTKGDDFDDCVGSTTVSALAIDLCGSTIVSSADARWTITLLNEDDEVINSVNAFGDSVSVTLAGVANTSTFIVWEVSDGCDNIGSDTTEVIFVDITDPVPLCITSLSTATMNTDGTAIIWASDYDAGSFDNCSEPKFFFLQDGISSPSYLLTCADIPNGISTVKNVELFVSDDAGNISSCNISIRVDDNNDVCPDSEVGNASISGVLRTPEGVEIEGARVTLNGRESAITDVNGAYAFADIPMESSYRIEAAKNDDFLNGVSTLDLVLIQRHILGLSSFDNIPDFIAADVNDDARVTAIDLVQIRRLILGLTNIFEDNSSWRFLDPTQDFENPMRPFPFIEELIILNLQDDMINQDLIGIKIGDINGNAIANSLLADGRSRRQTELHADDVWMKGGETRRFQLSIDGVGDLVGLQLALITKDAKIKSIQGDALSLEDIHLHSIDDNSSVIAWWAPEAMSSGEVISVTIEAEKDGYLSDMIQLDRTMIKTALYDGAFQEYDLDLSFDTHHAVSLRVDELYQNVPNPFSQQTTIGFDVSEEGEATFTVIDLSGRTLYTETLIVTQGYNEIDISSNDIGARGVLYYKLETGTFTATNKMIIID